MKLSPIYPPDVKPVHPGLYAARPFLKDLEAFKMDGDFSKKKMSNEHLLFYWHWDGSKWYIGDNDTGKLFTVCHQQNRFWFGILEE